jgi:MYXO-CTERM domain-containing protein
MATGAGLSGIMTALLPLVGLVTLWTARRRRLRGDTTPQDAEFERRQAERAEMERRMASYLAQSGSGGHYARDDGNEQEIRR